jgi:hypothetical protein
MGLLSWWQDRGLVPSRRLAARRVDFINGYDFPQSVLVRFRLAHPEIDDAGAAVVQAGGRQWFRVIARDPYLTCGMPSVAVDDLWHEFMLHTRDYAAFCPPAIGEFLHHQPNSVTPSWQRNAEQNWELLSTFMRGQADENLSGTVLPLLFGWMPRSGSPRARPMSSVAMNRARRP